MGSCVLLCFPPQCVTTMKHMEESSMRKFICGVLVLFSLAMFATLAMANTIITGPLRTGDHFYMGYYEQDNDTDNGREPIEWIVLNVNKDKTALVIASEAIEGMPYNYFSDVKGVAWGNTTLRLWLNFMFRYAAFNDEERACIVNQNVSGVSDGIWILNENEVKKYKLLKGTTVTPYAEKHGVQISYENGLGAWWVRVNSTDKKTGNAKFVGATTGKVYGSNEAWKRGAKGNAVRPVMVVDIEALKACEQSDEFQMAPLANYAVAIDSLATRSGPDTNYDEIHGFSMDKGYPVNVLREQETNGIPWVELEFMYRGKWYRVWTGEKRITRVFCADVKDGDYQAYAHGEVNDDTPGRYGPGEKYEVLYKNIEAGMQVEILSSENNWYLIQYNWYNAKDNSYYYVRTWVPRETVFMYE